MKTRKYFDLPAVYIDDSRKRVDMIDDTAEWPTQYNDLWTAASTLTVPHLVVLEASFYAFEIDLHDKFLEEFGRVHEIYLVALRSTKREAQKLFAGNLDLWKKRKDGTPLRLRDEVAVLTIRDMAQRQHLRKATAFGLTKPEHSKIAEGNHTLMVMRQRQEKDAFAEAIAKRLPDPHTLDEATRYALCGSGKGTRKEPWRAYSYPLVAVAGVAVDLGMTRDEFDKFAGLFQHAYPGQARSDVMHWGWANRDRHQPGKISLSEFRRAARWLYHNVKNIR